MYLPRGWLHSATALGDVSAHLTIGVHVLPRYALAESILNLIASDERLRTSLPLGLDLADPAQLAPHLDAVRAALTDAVAAVPAGVVSRGTRGRVWSGGARSRWGRSRWPRSRTASPPATRCAARSALVEVRTRLMEVDDRQR